MHKIANVTQEPVSAKDFIFHVPAGLSLPLSIDLRKYSGDIEDQLHTGSCTANATVSALEMMLQRAGKFVHLSRLFVYWNERESYANMRGKDTGAYLSDGFKSCYTYGVPPESVWPFVETAVNMPPAPSVYKTALATRVSKYQRVAQYPTAAGVDRIKTALALGYPVTIAIPVTDSLYYLHGDITKPTCWYTGAGKDIGGHAVNLVGYNADGFICENSWGAAWGDLGYCIIAYSVIRDTLMDAWTCTAFAGISQAPDFSFAPSKPLTASIADYVETQYLASSKDTTYYGNVLEATPEGDGPFAYTWTASDDSVTLSPEQFPVPVIDMSGWAKGETRTITLTCTVQDSAIPAQEATAHTLIRVCNSIDVESDYGKAYRLYKACLSRVPDAEGIKWWVDQIRGGMELREAASRFMDSAEFHAKYGGGVSDREFVNLLYLNVLGREPDEPGYAYWLGRLVTGYPKQDILVSFSESPENKDGAQW